MKIWPQVQYHSSEVTAMVNLSKTAREMASKFSFNNEMWPHLSKRVLIKDRIENDQEFANTALVVLFALGRETMGTTTVAGFMWSQRDRGEKLAGKIIKQEVLTTEEANQVRYMASCYSRQLAVFFSK